MTKHILPWTAIAILAVGCGSDDPNPCADADSDGVCDIDDLCADGDDTEDGDGDGTADDCDVCPLDNPDDTDGDGSCDTDDLCAAGDDTVDGDGDGVADACDPCPSDSPDDTDSDGVCDGVDACAAGDDTVDGDGDGVADACDPCPLDDPDDTDGDSVCDTDDLCPGADDGVDGDGDGVADACDPCPLDNPDDTDADTVCDTDDQCVGGDDTVDGDGDGVADACDLCPLDNPNDTDGDGVCDTDDACPDFDDAMDGDGDGVADACDPCPVDNPDDTDGDSVCDADDICPGSDDAVDTDGNGVPDGCQGDLGLLISDSGLDQIHLVSLTGTVLDVFDSPVANVRGVAHDRRLKRGFWVVGVGDRSAAFRVGWDRTVASLSLSSTANGVRGLDFYRDPADEANDSLFLAGNNGTVDVAYGFDPITGSSQYASSYYVGGFLRGVWGIHAVNYSSSGSSTWEYWTSWDRSTLERFIRASNRAETVSISVAAPRGLAQAADGTFWLVDATADRIRHLDTDGTEITSFATPGADPMGLSLGEGPI